MGHDLPPWGPALARSLAKSGGEGQGYSRTHRGWRGGGKKVHDFDSRVIPVKRGKGDKDRIVLFGRKAAQAMRDYLAWRPSQAGFLFEASARNGYKFIDSGSRCAQLYVAGVQREIRIGRVRDLPEREQARQEFD